MLVTGGAGFIGSHVVDRLLDQGCTVTVIDDLSEGFWRNLPTHKRLTKIKKSILGDVSSIMKGIDVVFHLAALPRLQRSIDDPLRTHNVNVNGTLNLLLAARNARVKRFVFSSSSSVYGNKNKLPFTEDMVVDPLVPYSLHKVIGEEYCRLFSNIWGLGTVSLRYFNVYGPRMNPNSTYSNLIPKFMKIIQAGKQPVINGDGTQTRDFTYISDVVEANILAAESSVSGEVFNIGYGKSISVNEVCSKLAVALGKTVHPVHGPNVREPAHTQASNTKAKHVLKWSPQVSFARGLQKMIEASKE